MTPIDETQRNLANRALELQHAINELAAPYLEEVRRREARNVEQMRPIADLLVSLHKVQQLGRNTGCELPECLTAEAEQVRAAIARNTTFFSGDSTPPADRSAN